MMGRSLSVVQHLGLDLLQRADTVAKEFSLRDDFRLARIAAGVDPEQVYPEYFVEDSDGDLDLNRDDVEYDYSGVEWQGAADAEAEQDMLAQFLSMTHVEVSESQSGEWH